MLDIIYQDESIVVCVKPFRVLSTDEPGGMPDRIREAIGQPQAKVRTVHRLDQVVGGLMVYGLTGPAASELSRQIREDTFLKEYQAVVHWRPQYDEGTFIDLLGRSEKTRKTYVAKYPGKGIQQAVLHYKLLDNKNGFSLVEIRLETGRTHQIRAQFSSATCPWRATGSTASTPTPKSGRSPFGPATWPLPTRTPARRWISGWTHRRPSLGPGSSPTNHRSNDLETQKDTHGFLGCACLLFVPSGRFGQHPGVFRRQALVVAVGQHFAVYGDHHGLDPL